MAKKSLTINSNLWIQLNKIKLDLNQNSKKEFHWNDVIEHILGRYSSLQGLHENKTVNNSISPPKPLLPPNLPKIPRTNSHSTSLKQNKTLKKDLFSMSEENLELSIPTPPKKKVLEIDVSKEQLAELTRRETDTTKFILIECQICGNKPIFMPVPKKLVLDATDPVVDVSYIHGDPEHVIVAQLDHDFQVRRRRASWVVYERDYR